MRNRIAGRKWLGIILALGLTALLLFTACAPASSPDGEKVLELGLMASITGPASSASQYAVRGAEEYIRYYNEEEGIPGVTVKLVWADTGHFVAQGLSTYNRWIERGIPLWMCVLVDETMTIKPLAERDKTPFLTFAISEKAMYPPGWVYSIYPTDAERFAVWCDWIMANWKEDRPPRVVMMGPDMAYGRSAQAQGTKYAESIGVEMLPMEFVPFVPLDTTTQLMRVNELGADFVYITSIWTTAVPILKDAERLGLMGKIQFGGYENSQSTAILALGSSVEGYTAPRVSYFSLDETNPGVKFMRDLQMKYRGRIDVAGDECNPIRVSSVACEALKRAVEEVGYENVDGVAVKRALDSIKDFDPYEIGPVTYTSDDHRGSNRVMVAQVQNGQVVYLTDWQDAPMLVP